MTKYWIGVASKNHVLRGASGGFAQVCHGKCGPLGKMNVGDWLVYYSPNQVFGNKDGYQKFTAIGEVVGDNPYQFDMGGGFIPWRIDVKFVSSNDISIRPLIENLDFIKNKVSWGYPFRRGCFEISEKDFDLIANAMGANLAA